MSIEDEEQSTAERKSLEISMEDRQLLWDEVERTFWDTFQRNEELEEADLKVKYQKALDEVEIEAKTLETKRIEAIRARDRQRQQLEAAEEELADITVQCELTANRKKDLEEDFKKNEEKRLGWREYKKRKMTRVFLERGVNQVSFDSEDEVNEPDWAQKKAVKKAPGKRLRRLSSQHSPERLAKRSRGYTKMGGLEHDSGTEADENREIGPFGPLKGTHQKPVNMVSALEPETAWAVSSGEALTVFKDADGKFIGPLKRIKTWNHWVKALQHRPIKRDIYLRRRRRFGRADLESIYKRMRKGQRLLACKIQASGEIKEKPCEGCRRGKGPFSECIFVEEELFPRCGNCEWSHQECCDAACSKEDAAEDESQEKGGQSTEGQARLTHLADRETSSQLGFEHEMEQELKRDSNQESVHEQEPNGQRDRQQLFAQQLEWGREIGPQEDANQQLGQTTSKALPARAKVTEADVDIDMAGHSSTSSPLTSLAPDVPSLQWPFEETGDVSSTPITRANLVLKHNGTIYTFPEIVDGVPVEKVDENHPYWDPTWHNLKSSTQQSLKRLREKLKEWKKLEATGAQVVQSQRLNLGRQINRGLKILDFLKKGEISPYQLLGKKFTVAGKGGITTYDTLFRLCETLSELEKFRLDVQPLEWMRHRIYEIWLKQGKSMSVCKVIGNFYNDPKLAALRAAAGLKSIGRPAGAGKADRTGGAAVPPSTDSPLRQADKRKCLDKPLVTSLTKRPRLSLDVPPLSKTSTRVQAALEKEAQDNVETWGNDEPDDDDDVDDDVFCSDTDTYSGGMLSKDDFRVYQIKSRLYTSSASVTQYLHWVRGKHKFEHQVLKGVNPVHWGFLKQPIDFDVLIKDIARASFNPYALLLELTLREKGQRVFKKDGLPQGNVMIAFKRLSTLKRFLICLRDLSIPATNLPAEVMRDKWDGMKSEQLPDADGEASDELLK